MKLFKLVGCVKDMFLEFIWKRRVIAVYLTRNGTQLKVTCYKSDCDQVIKILQKAIVQLKKHKKS